MTNIFKDTSLKWYNQWAVSLSHSITAESLEFFVNDVIGLAVCPGSFSVNNVAATVQASVNTDFIYVSVAENTL